MGFPGSSRSHLAWEEALSVLWNGEVWEGWILEVPGMHKMCLVWGSGRRLLMEASLLVEESWLVLLVCPSLKQSRDLEENTCDGAKVRQQQAKQA